MDVPGFEIKKTIGKGGMGTAYLAVQESLGRQVVLKTMNTSQADQTDFLERFLNEGRIVAALRHPHIITIFDIGATDDVVYMSMEYVDGGDLKDKIQLGCNEGEALNVVENIADALHFAHGEGVIHRDVKPANILYRVDGTPLLTDFGIAKQTKVDAELTSTGTILGSPFYMSPEQAEGHKVDGRADIYSLGIIFYEMLTGERPYPGDSAIKIIVQHIQSPGRRRQSPTSGSHRTPHADFPHGALRRAFHSTTRCCNSQYGSTSFGRCNGYRSKIRWNTSQGM